MALTTSMLRLEEIARDNTGKWKPGRSANPLGRSVERAGAVDIAALARSYSVDALKTLVHCLRDPRYKLAAAVAILDRGYGKPHISVHSDNQHTVLHLVAAEAVGNTLLDGIKPESVAQTINADVTDASDDAPTE